MPPDALSIREQIMLALLSRLQALQGLTVERNRRAAVDTDALAQPLLNLLEMGHTTEVVEANDAVYSMQIVIDMTVPAATDDLLGPTLNALYAKVIRCVMADYSLSGLVENVAERGFDVRVLASTESSAPLAECSLDLMVTFRTRDGDPCIF